MHFKKQQNGFVLIMSLVLLIAMTLIGVSSINRANIGLKATTNARQHHTAFNAVQSVLEFAVSGSTNLDFQNTLDQAVDVSLMTNTSPDVTALSGTSIHAGCSVGVGSSLEEGKGFAYNFFEVTADGYNKTSGGTQGLATSRQAQGIRFPAAACDN